MRRLDCILQAKLRLSSFIVSGGLCNFLLNSGLGSFWKKLMCLASNSTNVVPQNGSSPLFGYMFIESPILVSYNMVAEGFMVAPTIYPSTLPSLSAKFCIFCANGGEIASHGGVLRTLASLYFQRIAS